MILNQKTVLSLEPSHLLAIAVDLREVKRCEVLVEVVFGTLDVAGNDLVSNNRLWQAVASVRWETPRPFVLTL